MSRQSFDRAGRRSDRKNRRPARVAARRALFLETLEDRRMLASFTIADVTQAEGNVGSTPFVFAVSLSEPLATSATVNYSTAAGSAGAGDFTAASGSVSFSPGSTSQAITVNVTGDTVQESSEQFTVNLSAPTGAFIADFFAVGTITNDDAPPTVSVSGSTLAEGDAGTSPMSFTVTLSYAANDLVQVLYATSDGTAVAASGDYSATGGVLYFSPGVTTQNFNVQIIGDTTVETNETFNVTLSSPSNATLGTSTAIGTITNDDAPPTIAINDVTIYEGNSGSSNANFSVTLNKASSLPVTVAYIANSGTATSGTDFTATSGTLTFAANVTVATIAVPILGDVLAEPNETFTLDLSSPSNATIADAQGLGTILNDDAQPNLSIADASIAEGNSGTVNLLFTVSLSAVAGANVTVNVATADGTATAGSDYVAIASTPLTIAAGQTTGTVTVTVNGDTLYENHESFVVNLSGASGASLADSQGAGVITNDDTQPNVNVGTPAVAANEGNSGTSTMTFNVALDAISGLPVTVNFTTMSGSAVAGSDFVATSGTVTIPAGSSSASVPVTINGDTLLETDEVFSFNISDATNALITVPPIGLGTITNDDGTLTVSIGNATVAEGNAGTSFLVFTVSLNGASGTDMSVDYATTNGTAIAPGDYTAVTTNTLSIPAGQTTAALSIAVAGDVIAEANETLTVTLSNAMDAFAAPVAIGTATGTGTITNDDGAPTISINSVSANEGNAGTTNFVFAVTLSVASSTQVTVDYATTDVTALQPGDYTQVPTTPLTFAPGTTSQNVTITVVGDTIAEPNETFTVNLSNAVGTAPVSASIAVAAGTGTILNDDAAPTISITDVTLAEGNAGSTNFVFSVLLSSQSASAITVAYATANGSALAGSDYTAASGTLTFAALSTSQAVTVAVTGDTVFEVDESFQVNLSNPTNASITDFTGAGSITNDDTLPTLSIGAATVAEGNAGTSNLVFTVTLSYAASQVVQVNFASADGTATLANSDYSQAAGALIFPIGTTQQTLTVNAIGDTTTEPDENLTVVLSSPTNATITTGTGTGTITNDDAIPVISIANASIVEGHSGTSTLSFAVTLDHASSTAVTVGYTSAGVTATSGTDFVAASGTLTFPAGVTSSSIGVTINGDVLAEPNETLTLTLAGPSGGTIGGTGVGSGTILNDDQLPNISIDDVSVTEGNAGTANLVFTISLSAVSGGDTTMNVATANGTATAGTDYTAVASTPFTIAAGQTTGTVTVTVTGETLYENDETLFVNLSSVSGANVADSQGQGTITNDDALPDVGFVPGPPVAITEGNSGTSTATFTVSLSAASGLPVTVEFTTVDGNALAGSDYVATAGTLSIPAGSTTGTVTVTVNGDTLPEADEVFAVVLSNPTNASLMGALVNQSIGSVANDDGMVNVSIADVAVAEGNSGTSVMTFTVTLSAVTGTALTIDYAAVGNTATDPSDFTAAMGTVSIPAGSTTATFDVTINGDMVAEANETIDVTLSNPSDPLIDLGAPSDLTAVGTITNDDGAPTISINSVTLNEGNSGTTNFVFAVTLSVASSTQVTVDYATANVTATQPGDYAQVPTTTLTFAPGTTSQNVTIAVVGDTTTEPNETFTVNLSNAVGTAPVSASIATATGTGTILNDDAPPTISITDVTLAEGNAGSTNFVFSVLLSGASSSAITVDYATANGSALAGSDYTATSGTVTFAASTTSQAVTVAVTGDTVFEVDESFQVNLSNPTNASIADFTGVGSITNDDTLPTLSIGAATVAEGNAGTSNLVFTVTLSYAASQAVQVNFASANGSATLANSDYSQAAGTLIFPIGTTQQTLTVNAIGDTTTEPDENLTVILSSPTNATIATGTGTGTITNDDANPVISIANASAYEGHSGTSTLSFAITLDHASSTAVTVGYSTAGVTATSGTDFVAAGGTLTFPAGVTSTSIGVTINGDVLAEPNETFTLTLAGPSGGTIGGTGIGTGTILNDDQLPNISISDATIAEGNAGTVDLVFTISLSAASGGNVTMNIATADGTATTADTDYVAIPSTPLTIAAGSTTATVTVTVNGDTLYENDEALTLNLSSIVGANVADSQGAGTITNDDTVPDVSLSAPFPPFVTEGNAGTTDAVFTVTLLDSMATPIVSGLPVTVQYTTNNANATAGSDYVAQSGTLTIAAGSSTGTITVPVNGDTLPESDEFFTVSLSNATNANLLVALQAAAISNDDGTVDLSINDVSIAEGNSGSSLITFTVSLSAVSGTEITVDYATADNTATDPTDYIAAAGTATIPAGSLSTTISVQVNGDMVAEANEIFDITVSNPNDPALVILLDAAGVGTITNDEAAVLVSINSVSLNEGNAGTTNFVFAVTLNVASSEDVTVNYSTTDGTATQPGDYAQVMSTPLTFTAGQTSQNVTIAVVGDTTTEPNETFTVNLSGAMGGATVPAAIGTGTGTGTILNDDAAPTIAITDVTLAEGNAGTTNFVFSATLSNASSSNVTVAYATSNGSALAGSDYTAASGTLTFTAGATSQAVTVAVTGDTVFEANETFNVNLSSPSNASIADFIGVGTITNDDALPTLSIAAATVAEGNAGTSNLVFSVTLSYAASQVVQVNFASANGTATLANSDYSQAAGTVIFSIGSTSQAITVNAIGDTTTEPDENLTVTLSSPSNATIATGTGTGTITNDDANPVISVAGVTVNEGNSGTTAANFAVTLDHASATNVTVGYSTAGVTATSGTDFVAASGTLTFTPGQTSLSVPVSVNGDTIGEANETFTLALAGPSGGTIGTGTGTGTILNDDALPTLSINDVSAAEGNVGTTNSVFTVTLSQVAGQAVTVQFATADATASAGTDYTALPATTLTIAAGASTGTITVAVTGDTTNEANETFQVNLSSPVNATLADSQGIGTITNDDAPSGAAAKRFDFNSGASPTAAGFLGVGPAQTYSSANGYGYLEVPTGGFDRGAVDTSMTTDDLYRDGHMGVSNAFGGARRFRVRAEPGFTASTYTARLYVGDFLNPRNAIRLRYGASLVSAQATTAANVFQAVTLTGIVPVLSNVDGNYYIDLTIEDLSTTFGVNDYTWTVVGLDVWTGTDPGAAPLTASGSGSDGASLDDAALAPIVSAALARWQAAGLNSAESANLDLVQFEIRDLSAQGYLGLASPGLIVLDDDGAGHGWFVDGTPDDDAEFVDGLGTGAAASGVDLLSVVSHELGHLLGLDDNYGADHADEVMGGTLGAGQRRTPTSADLAGRGGASVSAPLAAEDAIVGLAAALAERGASTAEATEARTTALLEQVESHPRLDQVTAQSLAAFGLDRHASMLVPSGSAAATDAALDDLLGALESELASPFGGQSFRQV